MDEFGLIADNHFSESFLKVALAGRYKKIDRLTKTARAIPKKDLLSTVLIHGKLYLAKPTWLSKDLEYYNPDFSTGDIEGLDPFIEEGVIEWIPEQYYRDSYDEIEKFTGLLDRKIALSWNSIFVSFDSTIELQNQRDMQLEAEDSEITFDLNLIQDRMLYNGPIVSSNLNHLGLGVETISALKFPFVAESAGLLPHGAFLEGYDGLPGGSFLSSKIYTENHFAETIQQLATKDDTDEFYFHQSAVYDSVFSSMAIEKFAADRGFPIRTSSARMLTSGFSDITNDEAYRLIKIQFDNFRYPVIETIDDVLRLRNSKHFDAYRNVILEYSEKLRSDIEDGRTQVLNSFKKDLHNTHSALYRNYKWSSIVADWTFYLSIPLAMTSVLTGAPISDAIIIPITGASKYIAQKNVKNWIGSCSEDPNKTLYADNLLASRVGVPLRVTVHQRG